MLLFEWKFEIFNHCSLPFFYHVLRMLFKHLSTLEAELPICSQGQEKAVFS